MKDLYTQVFELLARGTKDADIVTLLSREYSTILIQRTIDIILDYNHDLFTEC